MVKFLNFHIVLSFPHGSSINDVKNFKVGRGWGGRAQGSKIYACLKNGDLGVLGGGFEKFGEIVDVIYGWILNSLLIF